jgi:uroporphyrinogen-III decarboxylase
MNFLLEPEAMMELCEAIGEYRYQYMKLIVDHYHPDIMLSHDDWGSKNALFMSQEIWREFIKPHMSRPIST